jgi:uncharacterized protein (TIGR00251 family)
MKGDTPENSLKIVETADGIIFSVYVQPKASRNELCGVCGNELKLRLTSPPVEGAANRLCTEYLADLLGIAKSRLVIIKGQKSRHKTIKAVSVKKEDFLTLITKHGVLNESQRNNGI